MSWRIGNHGFVMTLSPRIPKLIRRVVRPWLDDWLARHGLSIEAVGSWAVHPGGPAILSAFGECTGLGRSALETSYGVLAEYGNMSSPTVLFILDRLRRAGARALAWRSPSAPGWRSRRHCWHDGTYPNYVLSNPPR